MTPLPTALGEEERKRQGVVSLCQPASNPYACLDLMVIFELHPQAGVCMLRTFFSPVNCEASAPPLGVSIVRLGPDETVLICRRQSGMASW